MLSIHKRDAGDNLINDINEKKCILDTNKCNSLQKNIARNKAKYKGALHF